MQTKSKVQVLLTKPLADKLTMIANANNKSKGVMLRQLIVDDANDRYIINGASIIAKTKCIPSTLTNWQRRGVIALGRRRPGVRGKWWTPAEANKLLKRLGLNVKPFELE
jgi:hypothetical protein